MRVINLQDIRYGARSLLKNPAVSAIAILTLTLGIGATVGIFTIADRILLRPLPYHQPERLVSIGEKSRKLSAISVSYMNFLDYRSQSQLFEQMGAYRSFGVDLTEVSEPERLDAFQVSQGFFETLGVPPMLGHTIRPEDDKPGANPVTVLTHALWARRFNSDPNVIGKVIRLNGVAFTVAGVMPEGFRFPRIAQLWVPLGYYSAGWTNRANHQGISVLARLTPGVSEQQARAEMDTIAARLEKTYPASNDGIGVTVTMLNEVVVRSIRPTLQMLLVAVGFLLLIACVNVANLLLARGVSRQKELSIRGAMGATRPRLIRQLLTESALLSLIGGGLGVLLAYAGISLFKAVMPAGVIPRQAEVAIDPRILGFTVLISLLTGIFFGILPALRASKLNFSESLKEGGKGAPGGAQNNRLRSVLVVTEISLAMILLVGGGLMVKSFIQLLRIDPGFTPNSITVMNLALPAARYPDGQRQIGFYQQLLPRIQALPGVQAAGIVNPLPFAGGGNQAPVTPEGRSLDPKDAPLTDFLTVSPGYFEAMSLRLIKGRYFTDQDTDTSPLVAVIDETLAKNFWPGQDPLGKRVTFETTNNNGERVPRWREVVGVVGHVKHYGLSAESRQQLYTPYLQMPLTYRGILPSMSLTIRSASNQPLIIPAARSAVLSLDNNLPVYNISTMGQIVSDSIARTRLAVWLLGTFSVIGLLLAAVGVYGVIAYSVSQRAHEIGVRMALGAQTGTIRKMIVSQGMKLSLLGLAIGVAGAFALVPVMATLLWGVSARDLLTFIVTALLLVTMSLIACYLPARRATKVDPIIALRNE